MGKRTHTYTQGDGFSFRASGKEQSAADTDFSPGKSVPDFELPALEDNKFM